MSLTQTTYLVVGASFALYIFIAFRSRAGSTQEFYVAGKGILLRRALPRPRARRRPGTRVESHFSCHWFTFTHTRVSTFLYRH